MPREHYASIESDQLVSMFASSLCATLDYIISEKYLFEITLVLDKEISCDHLTKFQNARQTAHIYIMSSGVNC